MGFTALGLVKQQTNNESDDNQQDIFGPSAINGVLFWIPKSSLKDFDCREVGYDRVEISSEHMKLDKTTIASKNTVIHEVDNADTAAGGILDFSQSKSSNVSNKFQILPGEKIWVYIPQ